MASSEEQRAEIGDAVALVTSRVVDQVRALERARLVPPRKTVGFDAANGDGVLAIGMTVIDSPRGAGIVTGITRAGFPQVNGVAVSWLVFADGSVFDPCGIHQKKA